MKFVVTYVRLSAHSRRRVGKAATQVVDTEQRIPGESQSVFLGLNTPHEVERAFEELYAKEAVTAKVVDVRMIVPGHEGNRASR